MPWAAQIGSLQGACRANLPPAPMMGSLKVLQIQRVLQHALPRTAASPLQLGWHLHLDLCGLLQPEGLLLQRPWHSSCGESGQLDMQRLDVLQEGSFPFNPVLPLIFPPAGLQKL